MNKFFRPAIYALVFQFLISSGAHGQAASSSELIRLGAAYKDYMFAVQPDKKYLKKFTGQFSARLKTEAEFIRQTIRSGNGLLEVRFLTLPDEGVLKNLYIIHEINLNLREESGPSNQELADSLAAAAIPRYALIDNYYGMLFTGVGNKNQPFDLSGANFKPDTYGLQTDTEIGIFFLRCMDLCGTNIWGYMNIPDPPNTAAALALIKKFPRFNDKPYFQFTDLYFRDFVLVISKDKGKQSYKQHYLNRYFELLLSHLSCLNREGGSESEKNALLLGSVLKDDKLYKYTNHRKTLEGIFRVKKRD